MFVFFLSSFKTCVFDIHECASGERVMVFVFSLRCLPVFDNPDLICCVMWHMHFCFSLLLSFSLAPFHHFCSNKNQSQANVVFQK